MRATAAAALALLGTSPAIACMLPPATLSWEELIWKREPIFIGTVVEVRATSACPELQQDDANTHCAVFQVDVPVKGELGATHTLLQFDPPALTDCDNLYTYTVGERWLMAADVTWVPSARLDGKTDAEVDDLVRRMRAVLDAGHPPEHAEPSISPF
jgi:hypothetical protein